jgi:hypothetical protein
MVLNSNRVCHSLLTLDVLAAYLRPPFSTPMQSSFSARSRYRSRTRSRSRSRSHHVLPVPTSAGVTAEGQELRWLLPHDDEENEDEQQQQQDDTAALRDSLTMLKVTEQLDADTEKVRQRPPLQLTLCV